MCMCANQVSAHIEGEDTTDRKENFKFEQHSPNSRETQREKHVFLNVPNVTLLIVMPP